MALKYSNAIDPNNRTAQIGIMATRGGEIILDELVGEMFKFLHVATAGDVIIEGVDGTPMPWYGASSDSLIPIAGFRVLSSAIINGIPRTTTCTGITWYGGV
jgi:hypothetical protein